MFQSTGYRLQRVVRLFSLLFRIKPWFRAEVGHCGLLLRRWWWLLEAVSCSRNVTLRSQQVRLFRPAPDRLLPPA